MKVQPVPLTIRANPGTVSPRYKCDLPSLCASLFRYKCDRCKTLVRARKQVSGHQGQMILSACLRPADPSLGTSDPSLMVKHSPPHPPQVGIWDDPNVLVVHLKRFNASPFSLGGKVGRHVKFGPYLDLRPYSARHLQLERPEQGGISGGLPPSKTRFDIV